MSRWKHVFEPCDVLSAGWSIDSAQQESDGLIAEPVLENRLGTTLAHECAIPSSCLLALAQQDPIVCNCVVLNSDELRTLILVLLSRK